MAVSGIIHCHQTLYEETGNLSCIQDCQTYLWAADLLEQTVMAAWAFWLGQKQSCVCTHVQAPLLPAWQLSSDAAHSKQTPGLLLQYIASSFILFYCFF